MKEDKFSQTILPDTILDDTYLELLNKFKKYKSYGNKLFCSYMSIGEKYDYELLVIGREPIYWGEDFSVDELITEGEENIFRAKIRNIGIYVKSDLCPLNYIYENSFLDPFWSCIKEVVVKLGICPPDLRWSSYLALTNLYKVSYSSKRYILDKPKNLQIELCKKMLKLEIEILKPKRILFLTGMRYAKEFLSIPEGLIKDNCVFNLGKYNYGNHKAQTVVSSNPQVYSKEEVVRFILEGFIENSIFSCKHLST